MARDKERECRVCGEVHPIEEFINKTTDETGRICRLCINKRSREQSKQKRDNDPEYKKKCTEKTKAYYHKRKDDPEFREKKRLQSKKQRQTDNYKIKSKLYRDDNIEKLTAYCKDRYIKKKEAGEFKKSENYKEVLDIWRKNNPEHIKEYSKKYYTENIDQIKARKKLYRQNNKDKIRDYQNWWRNENKEKCGELSARRRARKRNATPKWLTKEDYDVMRIFYEEAQRLTKETGVDYAVDHIHPLAGENFSGLHVPWNLQILTRSENSSKKNKLI